MKKSPMGRWISKLEKFIETLDKHDILEKEINFRLEQDIFYIDEMFWNAAYFKKRLSEIIKDRGRYHTCMVLLALLYEMIDRGYVDAKITTEDEHSNWIDFRVLLKPVEKDTLGLTVACMYSLGGTEKRMYVELKAVEGVE